MSAGETSTEATGSKRGDWWSWGLEARTIENPGQRTYSADYRPPGAAPFLAHPMEPRAGSATVPPAGHAGDGRSSQPRRRLLGRRKRG